MKIDLNEGPPVTQLERRLAGVVRALREAVEAVDLALEEFAESVPGGIGEWDHFGMESELAGCGWVLEHLQNVIEGGSPPRVADLTVARRRGGASARR